MIVAGLQTDIAWEDPKENFRRVGEMAREAMECGSGSGDPSLGADAADSTRATGSGPDLLVLPEMFATGFSMDAVKVAPFADETRYFLEGLAKRHGVHVLGGYAEPAEPLPANACSIFDPTGKEILHFRKLHPFTLAGEAENYIAGESVVTAEIHGVRITPFICYDLRFPEPFRAVATNTDLYCVVANWPAMRRDAWVTLLRARAIENQAYVLGVNRVGRGDGAPYPGDSGLFNPLGRNAATEGPPPGEGPRIGTPAIVWGEVDPGEVTRIRKELGFLRDRKPELYRSLEEDVG
jgi:predicted amidohydrolase